VIEIRSYRRVFDLERRIYSVDRVRLNPGGVPVRGVVYFLAIALASLTVTGVPAIGALVRELPWYLRDVALPGAGATVLSAIRVEGRVFHLAAGALLRCSLGPRRLAAGRRCPTAGRRWRPQEIVLLPDGSDSRMRRMRYTGPGAVLVCVGHERRGRARELGASATARSGPRSVLSLRQPAGARALDRALVVSLASGARLLVSSARDRSG
jgi:hypothetical protein